MGLFRVSEKTALIGWFCLSPASSFVLLSSYVLNPNILQHSEFSNIIFELTSQIIFLESERGKSNPVLAAQLSFPGTFTFFPERRAPARVPSPQPRGLFPWGLL